MPHIIVRILICLGCIFSGLSSQAYVFDTTVRPAMAVPSAYMPLLKGKRVAIVVNQTSEYRGTHLLDQLLQEQVSVKRIFVPEHGFRGSADAGAHIASGTDSATGLPVISLYGKNKKPSGGQLAGIDVLVYDLQDVGVRFYTYISTLQYCMEACADAGISMVLLDRPNPNGFYVAGPVLDSAYASFVGMQPIPVVYGMTPGEYATMLAGERMMHTSHQLSLTVIPCINYTHSKKYRLPVAPSPNLRTMEAVYAYPSLCLFEGTPVSVGRGTDKPFCQYGAPELRSISKHYFIPVPGYGATKPPHRHDTCYGEVVAPSPEEALTAINKTLRIQWLIKAYKTYPTKSRFFTSFFTKLAGTPELERQIRAGMSEKEIQNSWKPALDRFKAMRSRYLLYPDF